MSLSGAACLRPLYFVECAKALLQPAGSSFSSGSVLSWTVRPHNRLIGRKADKEYLVGERCVTGHPFKRQLYSSSQHSCNLSCVIIQNRLREGGSENDDGSSNYHSFARRGGTSKESPLLLNLIQEIQPLDVTQIGKEASSDSIDAMKRTISGMLGLLPSNQFQVTVETAREPITKLLVSSMMTGYTLRNAEYRLSLQKSLEASDDEDVTKGSNKEVVKQKNHFGEVESILDPILNEEESSFFTGKALEVIKSDMHSLVDDLNILEPVGPLSKETKNYIDLLKRKLESISQELENQKRVNTGIQVQKMVSEEKNDLLDYLRSLAPEKVAELSQPTSPEVEDVIQHVIDELIDNPSTNLQHKGNQSGSQTGALSSSWDGNFIHECSSSPLKSQAAVTVSRDYLARLLFWCMLLGHHMRGLEYRLELSRALSLSGDVGWTIEDRKH